MSKRERTLKRSVSALAFLIALLAAGCAARAPRAMDIDVVPSPSLMLLDGTIVDGNERTGTITFKEKSDYTTWTIGVGEDARIVSAGQGLLSLEELRVGDRVRVSGRSRVSQVMIADEIWILTGD